jgi:serine/threonine protein phosphatase PrpC
MNPRIIVECVVGGEFSVADHIVSNTIQMTALALGSVESAPAPRFSEGTNGEIDGWPLQEARRLDAVLKERRAMALFAAVAARPGLVSVCTAGDIRVHLISNGQLQAVTSDHTFATDPLFVQERERVPPDMRALVATRGLGVGATAPPEVVSWRAPDEYVIAVCSADIHRQRPPTEYLDLLLRGISGAVRSAGLLCRVARSSG